MIYKNNDTVYVIDTQFWRFFDQLSILKKRFIKYSDTEKGCVELCNIDSVDIDKSDVLIVESWTTFKDINDAMKFGIIYLIITDEFQQKFYKIENVKKVYEEMERNYPHLIIKYMDKIVEEFDNKKD